MLNANESGADVMAEIVTSNELGSMTLDELGRFASEALGEGRRMQAEAVALSRKSTVMRYRAGKALSHAKKQMKGKRAWTSFQREHGIPISTARQAILLSERAKSEDELVGLTLTQAFKKFSIVPTKPKRDKSAQTATAEPASERPEAENVEPTMTTEVPPRADLHVVGKDACGDLSPEPGPDLPLSSRRPEADAPSSSDPETDEPTKPRKPESLGMPVSLGEVLFVVVRKLEHLELGLAETEIAQGDLDLMDQAIEALQRMRRCAVREKAA